MSAKSNSIHDLVFSARNVNPKATYLHCRDEGTSTAYLHSISPTNTQPLVSWSKSRPFSAYSPTYPPPIIFYSISSMPRRVILTLLGAIVRFRHSIHIPPTRRALIWKLKRYVMTRAFYRVGNALELVFELVT